YLRERCPLPQAHAVRRLCGEEADGDWTRGGGGYRGGRICRQRLVERGPCSPGAGHPLQDLRALQDRPLQPVREDGVPRHA
ncbi:unnamed protein product, partial [Hapterophycus canaliculatus]